MSTLAKTRRIYINAIADHENFKSSTGNLRGEWIDYETYVVYSYSTEIARWDSILQIWIVNATKYSVTTSHHQNIVSMALTKGV